MICVWLLFIVSILPSIEGKVYGADTLGFIPKYEYQSCNRHDANALCGAAYRCSVCEKLGGSTANNDCYVCCNCACFPSEAQVQLQNGKKVMMSELQVGDQVQTVSSEGRLRYNEVKTFLMKNDDVTTMYNVIETAWKNSITLSANHLIYTRRGYNDTFSPVYANEIVIGDDVLIQTNGKLTPEKVIAVSNVAMQGAYVPLTADGNIMVDGVLASCYASFDHDLAHLMMTPMQWCPEMIDWIFGQNDEDTGYVKLTKEFGRWILPQGLLYDRSNY